MLNIIQYCWKNQKEKFSSKNMMLYTVFHHGSQLQIWFKATGSVVAGPLASCSVGTGRGQFGTVISFYMFPFLQFDIFVTVYGNKDRFLLEILFFFPFFEISSPWSNSCFVPDHLGLYLSLAEIRPVLPIMIPYPPKRQKIIFPVTVYTACAISCKTGIIPGKMIAGWPG